MSGVTMEANARRMSFCVDDLIILGELEQQGLQIRMVQHQVFYLRSTSASKQSCTATFCLKAVQHVLVYISSSNA